MNDISNVGESQIVENNENNESDNVEGEQIFISEEGEQTTDSESSVVGDDVDQPESSPIEVEFEIESIGESDSFTNGGMLYSTRSAPEMVKLSGHVIWDDNDDEAGLRPIKVTVGVERDGKFYKGKTLYKEDNYDFGDVLKSEEEKYVLFQRIVPYYETTIEGFNIRNKLTNDYIGIATTIIWDDNNNKDEIRPSEVKVDLYANDKKYDRFRIKENIDWEYSVLGLPKYYNGKKIVYTVSEEPVEGYSTTIDGFHITNKRTSEDYIAKLKVKKLWDDSNNQDGKRPSSVTVALLADGKEIQTATITEDDDWTYSFKILPKYKDGKEIVYIVSEKPVEGYESTAVSSIDGFTITNKRTPEITNIKGVKIWDDNNNQDGKRPSSVTVVLLADGKEVKTATVDSSTNWSYRFKDLAKYKDGKEIVYTVSEKAIEGYESTIDGFNITNKHTPEVIKIEGVKIWDDGNNQDGKRPSQVTVVLLADGKEDQTVTVDSSTNWSYSFKDLPKYKDGKEIVYTVSEKAIEGYESTIDGFNITNKHTPEVTTIEGGKIWFHGNNQDGKRPSEVTVVLLADGKEVKTAIVDSSTHWLYRFKDLPKYKDGKEIVYTINERSVEGYTTSIEGYDIINKRNTNTTPDDKPSTPDDKPTTPVDTPSTPAVTLQDEPGSTTIDTTDSLSMVRQSPSYEPRVVSYGVILPETGEADVTFISIMLLILGSGLYIVHLKRDEKYN